MLLLELTVSLGPRSRNIASIPHIMPNRLTNTSHFASHYSKFNAILNPKILREPIFSKGIAFDVLVRLDSGALIDIEMQNRRTICFRARLI